MRVTGNREQHKLRSAVSQDKATTFGGYLNHLRDRSDFDLVDPEAHDAVHKSRAIGLLDSTVKSVHATVHKLHVKLKTQRKNLKKIFDTFDVTKSGELNAAGFGELLQYFCPGEISKYQARQVLKVLDKNRDGRLQWDEIIGFVKTVSTKTQ
jgi:hypothetical protein